jgi:hypothetical protein
MLDPMDDDPELVELATTLSGLVRSGQVGYSSRYGA